MIKQLVEILSPNGSICWQVGNYVNNGEIFPLDIYYYNIFKELGLSLRNRIIWHFGHGLHARRDSLEGMKPYYGLQNQMITLLI